MPFYIRATLTLWTQCITASRLELVSAAGAISPLWRATSAGCDPHAKINIDKTTGSPPSSKKAMEASTVAIDAPKYTQVLDIDRPRLLAWVNIPLSS